MFSRQPKNGGPTAQELLHAAYRRRVFEVLEPADELTVSEESTVPTPAGFAKADPSCRALLARALAPVVNARPGSPQSMPAPCPEGVVWLNP